MTGERVDAIGSLFRFITPVLVTITLFVVGQIAFQLNDLNTKMYHHATNDEIHVPRSELTRIETRLETMQKELTVTIREGHR